MKSAAEAADEAIGEVDRARKRLAKGTSKQISQADDIDYLKSVCYAWFNSHRKAVVASAASASPDATIAVDRLYQKVFDSTAKNAARTTYVAALKSAKGALAELRSALVLSPAAAAPSALDAPPDFVSLVGDPQMQSILVERWEECQKCLSIGAHLAATVMMGGLLEALFVARANQLADKSPLFTAKTTPIDKKTNRALPLPEWTLRPYIDVGHELGWISKSAKEVAEVLRDYRNYIHPEKQRSHGVRLEAQDGRMFWDVTRHLVVQLLRPSRS
jgi:hypothetical protein